ncbi:MAG: helix-turn-helix domain-containing protein [Planctomycetaceae bacterium]
MAVRRKRNLLDAVLLDSASLVCVLDADRRLRFFSPGMERRTGWSADRMEGLVCEPAPSIGAGPDELLTSALAPLPDVLGGRSQTLAAVLPTASGMSWRTMLSFQPILDADHNVARILIVCSDVDKAGPPTASLSRKLHAEITALRLEFRRRFSMQSFIGSCPGIRKALNQAELLKNAVAGYSIVGPSGSGRRHLARLIHVAGQHHETSFVALDCRLLTGEQLLDTLRQLRRLAADPALPHHQHTGTLTLLDADRCPREVQQWLLDNLSQETDRVRLVACSSEPLQRSLDEGWLLPAFHDLFSAVQITLPDLHHRGHDINLLAQHFVEQCRRTLETSAETLSADILAELQFYRWPGNVRELQQVIVDACQNSFETTLTSEDLPFSFRAGLEAQQLPSLPENTELSLEQILEAFEKDVLIKTLEACHGNKADAARRLGMTRPRLYRRLKTLGMETDE